MRDGLGSLRVKCILKKETCNSRHSVCLLPCGSYWWSRFDCFNAGWIRFIKSQVRPTTTNDGVDMITHTWGGFHWLRVKCGWWRSGCYYLNAEWIRFVKGQMRLPTTNDGVDMMTCRWGGLSWLKVVKGQMCLTTECVQCIGVCSMCCSVRYCYCNTLQHG